MARLMTKNCKYLVSLRYFLVDFLKITDFFFVVLAIFGQLTQISRHSKYEQIVEDTITRLNHYHL